MANPLAHLTRLTDWETGQDVFVDLSCVLSMERHRATVYDSPGDGVYPVRELGERTKLTLPDKGHFMVRETPREIVELSKKETI